MTSGLEDVVAAETVLSDVDGSAGTLTIRGFDLDALVGHTTFEATAHLLFEGFFDDLPDVATFTSALGNARTDVYRHMLPALPMLAKLDIYDGVRAGVALLPDGHTLADALRLLAAPAVLAPMLIRVRESRTAIEPNATLAHSADILRALNGSQSSPLSAALDAYLVTVCDHGLNASTFAARVVASTRAGLTSSVLAGLSALKGPLHGGAPGPVIEMLNAIEAHGDARAWLLDALARGERLMGFGHRVYRVRDPRADALKFALRTLGEQGSAQGVIARRLALAESVEAAALDVLRTAKPDRSLETNVEFYTALVLEAVGFTPDTFTCVFAMSRVAGWIAHAREQQITGRLIRPQSRYVGPGVGDTSMALV